VFMDRSVRRSACQRQAESDHHAAFKIRELLAFRVG